MATIKPIEVVNVPYGVEIEIIVRCKKHKCIIPEYDMCPECYKEYYEANTN